MKTYAKRKLGWLLGTGLTLLISGCSQQSDKQAGTSTATSSVESLGSAKLEAVADLNPTTGNDVRGTATFTQEERGVRVVADITGLKPGDHGFHIHEKGDCSAPDASSAGGHFNPTGMPHGGPEAAKHHLGDMGNITADAAGKAHLDRVFAFLDLRGTNSIIGHAVVVHQDKDDLTTQPTGNAGARVACGVIKTK
jgi:Cu-Zn family superoxide dismutase